MRERIVGAFVLLAFGILVVFSVARAYSLSGVVEEAESRKLQRSVVLLAELVEVRRAAGSGVDEAYLAEHLNEAERIDYVDADGARTTATAADYRPAEQESDLSESAAVDGGGQVTLRRSSFLVDERVSNALTPIVALGMLLVAVAAGLAYAAAALLARPFQELAGHAVELGRGRFDLGIPRYDVPEADTIGRALEQSAAQLHDLVRREREFASNVSHQLRTPITALRLELEDLSLWPETPEPVADELVRSLVQVDRLQATVTDLLDLARARRIGRSEDIDLAQVVRDTVARWRPAAGTRDMALAVGGEVRAHQAPGPVEQVLDVLLDNALRHGTGTVTVAVLDENHHVEVRVGDQGRSRPADEVFHRNVGSAGEGLGIGLTVAAEIAEALGGRLSLADAPGTTFVLQLPRGRVPSAPVN
jgi:signal transduction histidine kinase